VAHHATGDARGTGTDPTLVDEKNVFAAALAGLAEVFSEVPGRAQAMNTGTDDNEFHLRGKRHGRVHSEAGRRTGTAADEARFPVRFPCSSRPVFTFRRVDRQGSARP